MDCPRCAIELTELPGDDGTMHRCGECAGLWVDVADLNRFLLHANLPALSGIGGQVNPDEIAGQCPACNVDMLVVEGGEKRSLAYDTCESCGGIWLDGPDEDVEIAKTPDWKGARAEFVDFYRRFTRKR